MFSNFEKLFIIRKKESSSFLVCVKDISKVRDFYPKEKIYNGIDIANCKWYFYQEH